MLILTRTTGESINIGHDVEIKVLGVKGNQVRIGIEAPKQVKVLRKELYDKSHTPAKDPEEWAEGVPERIN